MLHHVEQSTRSRRYNARGGHCGLIVVALLLIFPGFAPAQMGEQVRPHLIVEFRVKLSPDADAQRAGAVTFYNQVAMAGGVWLDQFTGSGCIIGPFEPAVIDLRSLSEGDAHPFSASCRSRSKDDAVSLIEWSGNLQHGKISGDVWITLPGKPMTASALAAKRIDRDAAKRNATLVRADGTVVNEKAAEQAGREADRKNALLAAQGRRLRFTFTTEEVVIIPIGSWSGGKPPATRPSAADAVK